MLILAAVGLGVSLWLRPLPLALLLSLSGFLVGGVVWLTPYLFRMVGAADLKLAAAVGIWLGPLAVLRVSFHAALIGGGMALLWLVWSRGALGSWVFVSTLPRALRVGGGNVRPPSMSPGTLPFAVALLIGVGLELLGVSLVGGVR
jgi:prepilin peptidase CpaA